MVNPESWLNQWYYDFAVREGHAPSWDDYRAAGGAMSIQEYFSWQFSYVEPKPTAAPAPAPKPVAVAKPEPAPLYTLAPTAAPTPTVVEEAPSPARVLVGAEYREEEWPTVPSPTPAPSPTPTPMPEPAPLYTLAPTAAAAPVSKPEDLQKMLAPALGLGILALAIAVIWGYTR